MLSRANLVALSLTGLSFVTVNMATVIAGEPIIDRNCRLYQRKPETISKIPPENQGTVYFTSSFKANNQKYFLQVLKFPDSTRVFCLLGTNQQTNQRLTLLNFIQDKQIEKVEKLASQEAKYIVIVKGNNDEDVFRTFYKLNLSNPNQPQITTLVQLYKKPS